VRYGWRLYAKLVVFPALAGAVLLLGTVCAAADEPAEKGREILNKWQSSVVTVKLVVQMRAVVEGREGGKNERKGEVTGTIIDPSGLLAVSLFSADPNAYDSMMMGDEAPSFKMETDITDVKVRLSDGKELPAKIVLRDKDLDLAFVRLTQKPDKPLPAVDLSVKGELQVLDNLVILDRLGTVAGWSACVTLDRVQAIIQKPRRLYVPSASFIDIMGGGLGCPAFTLDGKVVGLLVLRLMPSAAGGMGSMFGGMGGMLPVVLPSQDILEVAKQAPQTAG